MRTKHLFIGGTQDAQRIVVPEHDFTFCVITRRNNYPKFDADPTADPNDDYLKETYLRQRMHTPGKPTDVFVLESLTFGAVMEKLLAGYNPNPNDVPVD
jgi:hypothetical protein